MGIFSWLTGNSKAAETAVDGAVKGLDALFFTEEEKSQASQKILELKIDYAKHTAFMSVSRRVIVVSVCAVWTLSVILMLALGLFAGADSVMFKAIKTVLVDVVMQPFSIIIGFYFLAHVASKARGKP